MRKKDAAKMYRTELFGSYLFLQSHLDNDRKKLLRALFQCYCGDPRLCKSLLGITQRNIEQLTRVSLSN